MGWYMCTSRVQARCLSIPKDWLMVRSKQAKESKGESDLFLDAFHRVSR